MNRRDERQRMKGKRDREKGQVTKDLEREKGKEVRKVSPEPAPRGVASHPVKSHAASCTDSAGARKAQNATTHTEPHPSKKLLNYVYPVEGKGSHIHLMESNIPHNAACIGGIWSSSIWNECRGVSFV